MPQLEQEREEAQMIVSQADVVVAAMGALLLM